MKTLLLNLLIVLVVLVVVAATFEQQDNKHNGRHKRHLFRSLRRGFKSIACRMRHWRTVLDRLNHVVGCVRRCGSNYRESVSFEHGHHCRPIERFIIGCSNRWCTRCEKTWFKTQSYYVSNRCVKKCPDGYYGDNSQRRCTRCNQPNCQKCSNSENCLQCNSNMILFVDEKANGKCLMKCPSDYLKVTDPKTKKFKCEKEIKPEMKEDKEDKEDESLEGCADRFCSKCKTGYFRLRFIASKLKCVKQCPIGYAVNENICRACTEPRCKSCQNDSLDVCTECRSGYYLLARSPFTNECVRTCPPTHELKKPNGSAAMCEVKPQRACTIKNCDECLHSDLDAFHVGCAKCKPKYFLKRDSFSDRCIEQCPRGFYESIRPGKVMSCLACDVPFCESCVSSSKCRSCIPPFVLSGETGRCELCALPLIYDKLTRTCISGDSVFNPTTTPPPPIFKIE